MSTEQGTGRPIACCVPLFVNGKIRRNTTVRRKGSGRRLPMRENKGLALGLALLVHLVLLVSLVGMKWSAGNGNSSVIKVELTGGMRLASGPAGGQDRGPAKAAAITGFEPLGRQSSAIPPTVPAARVKQPAVPAEVSHQFAAGPRLHAVTDQIRHFHRRQAVPHLYLTHRIPPRPVASGEKTSAKVRIASKSPGTADPARITVGSSASAAKNGTVGLSNAKAAAALTNGTAGQSSGKIVAAATGGSGSGASSQAGIRSYLAAVRARIEAAKQYPPTAFRRRIEGRVGVRFQLAADGRLLAVRLATASGFHELDHAALAAVRRAAPFPGFSDQNSRPRSFKVNIAFVVRGDVY